MTASNNNDSIGAALIVGGGIAGVQAALDLADSGVKVYMVEREPAIGGKMAQLDKTFPTNDCAMCILSPKLVEAGRHRNIEILPTTDLLNLEGEPGAFKATIRRRPRYISLEACTACNDCVEVCPITVPNEFNEGLNTRTATYKPYPQAVPSAYVISKKGTSPCKATCPADTSAQGYIALIAEKRYEEALEVIKQYNPFPATVGRVCHHPCETECNRGHLDSPVAICALKRFVADTVYDKWDREGKPEQDRELRPYPEAPGELPPEDRRQVAIVGAGPTGLSAAHFLARMGYDVTIFEALPVAGGMARVGIPAYRLPREVLNYEIDEILNLGVDLKLEHPIRNIDKLFDEDFAAVFLAIGAHEPQKLRIPGEDEAEGVFHGVPFLRAVALGDADTMKLGDRVAVVGGGNTAIDTARTALRLGSGQVTLVYRRTRAEMPANEWEIDEALEEGVKLENLTQPVEVLHENGHITGIRCVRMRLGEPDASGRRRPIPIEGSEFDIPCDGLVAAIAQAPEISFLDPDHGLEITRWGTFKVNEQTLETNRPGIFAGGDAAAGPGALIEGIAAGRRGALSIDRYLRGVDLLTPRELLPLPTTELSHDEIDEMVARGEVDLAPRFETPKAPVADRVGDFREVELCFSEEQALGEAARCLSCGLCSECYQCVLACKAHAIDHQQAPYEERLEVGAVVLAPGYRLFDAEHAAELGYGRYANVVTSMQFERLLSASGPTEGHITRLSDHAEPQRIAFLQCVGSRDKDHDYCSSVCCMYATKEAMLALDHVPGVEIHIFQIDMRAFSKGFDAYFERGQELGIHYHRCKISALKEDPKTREVLIDYVADDGRLGRERFDLVVLSVGMERPESAAALAQAVGIELDPWGFARTHPFHPVETTRPGVYVCGAFAEPKDIPDSVIEAGGAAAAALATIGQARGTLVTPAEYPPEIEVKPEDEPRVGVFICSCGSNIAGVVDVADVTEYAKTLPDVAFAENTMYTCSADSLKLIQERIAEHGLNRVIVSSCTPRTHEPIFRETIREAGLNPYLFEMANIRDQDSWVHAQWPDLATAKARDLTRMAVARSRRLQPLYTQEQSLVHSALIIGGGVAGMTAALNLAEQGYDVTLVERESKLGGQARHLSSTIKGGDPRAFVQDLIARVSKNPRIEVLTDHQVVKSEGFVGNFKSTLAPANGSADPTCDEPGRTTQRLVEHGVTIVATGGREYRGGAFGLDSDPRIITQGDLEQRVSGSGHQEADSPIPDSRFPDTVVMLQCVGPWDEENCDDEFYCSRICCSVAAKNALRLKEQNPKTQIFVLYNRDIRTYGFQEALYTQAREAGVVFLRYAEGSKPEVSTNGDLSITVRDEVLGQPVTLQPDLLVLSEAIVPAEGSKALAELLKFSCTLEGFFLEAHVKLQPVEFPAEGVFLAGAAHYPKLLDETIAQAGAAAARAASILSKDELEVGGVVAVVEPEKCTACLTCVRICPFGAAVINPALVGVGEIMGAAEITAAACRGCGLCPAECPAKAIQLQHFTDEQVLAKEEALFEAIDVALAV
ncbi:MAG: FAD-dependent oxidoreductase [Anaerolineae bacterium]|jgi:heterodisulfide reductase subunit A-like polyferredoxin